MPDEFKEPEPTGFKDAMLKAFTGSPPEASGTPPPSQDPAPVAKTPVPPPAAPNPAPASKGPVAEFGETKPLAQADDDDPFSKGTATPKASDWKSLKQQRNEARQKIDAYEREIAELRTKASTPTNAVEIEALRKEKQELSDRLRAFAVEKDPQFQQHFDRKIATTTEYAKNIVGGTDGEKLAKVLAMPDSEYRTRAIDEMVGNLSPSNQARVGAIMVQLDQIQQERANEIANSSENYSKLMQQQETNAKVSLEKNLAEFQNQLARASNLPVFKERDGDAEWNAQVAQRREQAKQIFSGQLDVNELARSAIWASAAPGLLQQLNASNQEVESLKAQIASMEKVTPDPTKTGSASKESDPTDSMSFGQRVVYNMQRGLPT